MQTFYALVKGGVPSDDASRLALIGLLSRETTYIRTLILEDDNVATYYSNVVGAVVLLRDVRSLSLLVDLIDRGRMVTDSIASFGPAALDAVVARSSSPDLDVAMGAAMVVNTMLAPDNVAKVADPVSLNKIRIALDHLAVSQTRYTQTIAGQAKTSLAAVFVVGDLNGDRVVDCKDIVIAQASLGKRTSQNGFDARADVNLDGVVDIRDLSFVSQRLPSGTRCQ
jgi:hypothetical protein